MKHLNIKQLNGGKPIYDAGNDSQCGDGESRTLAIVTLCCQDGCRCFGGSYCLHHQERLHEEIRSSVKAGYVCYQPVQNYSVATFMCGCETWSLMLREDHRLKAIEKRVLRRYLGLRGKW